MCIFILVLSRILRLPRTRNIKVKIYRTVNLPIVLYEYILLQ
jgi:hypothetical protein